MLSLVGDILNWMAVSLLFPLMLMPLAHLFNKRFQVQHNLTQSFIYIALILGVVLTGCLFIYFTPWLEINPFPPKILIWALGILGLGLLSLGFGGIARSATKLAILFEAITKKVGRTAMWLVFIMAIAQFMVVILRHSFGLNFIWLQESIVYMHGSVFLLAAGYALLTDDHVRVDIFYRGASPRRKALINLFGTYFLMLPVCLLLLWTASPYVFASWQSTEGSAEVSGVQLLFLLKSLIPAYAIFLLMAAYTKAMESVDTLYPTRLAENGVS